MREYRVPSGEEIARIKSNDREAIDGFFMRNYELIEEVARGWLLRKVGRFDRSAVEELRDEAYLWLPNCDLDDKAHFVVSLRDCFFYFHYDGRQTFSRNNGFYPASVVSLDAPVMAHGRSGDAEEGTTLGALLPARQQRDRSGDELQYAILLAIVGEILTPKVFEVFRYRLLTGYTSEEIAEELGKSVGAVLSQLCEARKVLVLHYDKILFLLRRCGRHCADHYLRNNIVPPDYESVKAFFDRRRERGREAARAQRSTAEGREIRNRRLREYRARKQKEGQKPEK